MTSRARSAAATLALALLLGVVAGPLASAPAAAAPAPADQVLGIISPIAAPVCSAVGSATFLVPVVGGLATSQLTATGINVGDTLLDVLGPLFVVCGNLPGAQGTRCELDAQIAGIYPAELKQLLPPPTVLGGVVEGANKLLALLGLPPDALGVAKAFQCTVPEGATAPPAPAAPPPIGAPAPRPTFPAPLPPGSALTLPEVISPTGVVGTPGPATQRTTLVSRVVRTIPGYMATVQGILATLLVAYLGLSWITSARLSRRRSGR